MSKMLHLVLAHFRRHFQNYCNVIKTRTGTNCFWSIQNNSKLITDLTICKATKSQVNSFDFSTLYTNLEHSVILQQLFKLVDLLFRNNQGRQYLAVNRKACFSSKVPGTCFYSDKPNSPNYAYLEVPDIKYLIQANIAESYVRFGECTFRQTMGISMGGSASPMIADLTLAMLEFRFLSENQNRPVARRLLNTYRYIDDICTTQLSKEEFLEVAKEIYPPSIPLNHSSGDLFSCDYLDLRITFNPSMQLSVFDKTEYFNFDVVKFGFAESNVPTSLGYNVFFSQLVRYSRICTNKTDFCLKTKSLVATMTSHQFETRILNKKFKHFAFTYRNVLNKYGIISDKDTIELVNQIFA